MKTILIVIPQLGVGGAEKLIVDLLKNIDYSDIKIHLLVLYKPDKDNFFLREIKKTNVDCHILCKKKGFDIPTLFRVRKLVKQIHPDVIHTHLDSIFSLLLSFNKKQEIFHTVHNVAEKEATGMQKQIRKYCIRHFNMKMVAISDSIRESISKYYKIPLFNIPVIYNGIDTKKFTKPSKFLKNNNKFEIISIGRLTEQKNYFEMLEIIGILNKTKNVELKILGDGHLRESILEKIDELQLNDVVTLVGNINNVNEYLWNADMFLSTSSYEGLPLSMLEAMASGLPIVGTKVGGVPDIIKDGVNGFLYTQGNKIEAIQHIELLITNNEIRNSLALKSKKMSALYDIEYCASRYKDLYMRRY